MRDLEIWRRLHAGTADAVDLDALAQLPLVRRGPFLAHVVRVVAHADPRMRAAAVDTLTGCRGVLGLRAIVTALDDEDATVRAAAIRALRGTALEAPMRYTHALFHPRVETRIAALTGELPHGVRDLAMYLRADPACAELAAHIPWPDDALAIAVELHVAGHVGAAELVQILLRTPPSDVRTFLTTETRREPDAVDSYLDRAAGAAALPADGHDVLDTLVRAIASAAQSDAEFPLARVIDRLVEIVTPRKQRVLARRAAVALVSERARRRQHGAVAPLSIEHALLGACVALEPRAIGYPDFDASCRDTAIAGLVRYRWVVKPTPAQTEHLLELPIVRDDLALAAAVAGLLPAKRLATLAKAVGASAIIDALVAGDRGWDEICQLPAEAPPLELRWLAVVESRGYERYIALCGRTIRAFTAKRLDAFVEQMQRRHRERAFIAALRARDDMALHVRDSAERLAAVCRTIAARVDRPALTGILAAVLDEVDPALRKRVVLALVRAHHDKQIAAAATPLTDAAAELLVVALDDPTDVPPRDRELAIAAAFAPRASPSIRDWCKRVASPEPVITFAVAPMVRRELAEDERAKIASCSLGELARALTPAFGAPVTGLVAPLSLRVAAPSVHACAALLGCSDPIADVARQLDRFANSTPRFDGELDDQAAVWLRIADTPPLANARLYRWEAHTIALGQWLASVGTVHDALIAAEALPGWLARQTLWRGISEALMFFRYRDRPRFDKEATAELAQFAAERVDRDIGRHAARIVVALVEGGAVAAAGVRDRVLDRIADADAETREYASRIVRLDGVAEPPRVVRAPVLLELVVEIRASRDVEALVRWCYDARPAVVEEATLALLSLGAVARLAALLPRLHELTAPLPIVTSVILWDDDAAVAIARELSMRAALPLAWQFHLNLALAARGEPHALGRALDAARAAPSAVVDDSSGWFFRRDDWDALVRVAGELPAAIALADAHHHHAYQRAAAILIAAGPTPEVVAALHRFLEVDGDRPLHLRRSAAHKLAEQGDLVALPVLVEEAYDERDERWLGLPARVFDAGIETIVDAALIGGPTLCADKRLLAALDTARSALRDLDRIADLYAKVLEHSGSQSVRRIAASRVLGVDVGNERVRRVAEVFAWGIRRGVELAGRLFTIHMTTKERDLGHTRLDGNRIFVSALPMLRNEPHGQDVVEGLVLHEIGHHVYHRGEAARALWARAHREGIGHLLNLIADEHLERNLRAHDAEFGDRLKRLGAYAFQHAPQEIKVATLLDALRGSSATALIGTTLEVAFDDASVRLRRGAILTELDRAGHPLARFARALRLGFGNRANDPQLAIALDLCRGIRELDMQQMYDLTWKLANMFGGSIACARVFGGPEGLEFGERDDDVYGAGIDDDVLQKEVERILDPKRNKAKPTGPINKLWINVNPDDEFQRITSITRVRGNRDVHARTAALVERHATRLRALLDDLGLRWEPQKARTQGRALDRSRMTALVTRNDPRILVARTPTRRTDLFLGTIVDCSGSMTAGDNIERARRFAVLVAEAVRPLPGVEARFFGFTDSVIYDAGDARDCGVVGLVAEGGNNDAAALYHVANLALASRKRAKVIVMISDGLPTECSVAALSALVTQLTRRKGIVCAQVAVRDIEDKCFPHYVVLDDAAPDVAVARFGRMIGDLARRSLLG